MIYDRNALKPYNYSKTIYVRSDHGILVSGIVAHPHSICLLSFMATKIRCWKKSGSTYNVRMIGVLSRHNFGTYFHVSNTCLTCLFQTQDMLVEKCGKLFVNPPYETQASTSYTTKLWRMETTLWISWSRQTPIANFSLTFLLVWNMSVNKEYVLGICLKAQSFGQLVYFCIAWPSQRGDGCSQTCHNT